MDYPAAYYHALKFSTDSKPSADPDLTHMLEQFDYSDDATRHGRKGGDHTLALVLADKLQEHGRDLEAALLRDRGPVKVVKTDFDHSDAKIAPDHPSHGYGSTDLIYHHRNGHFTLCPGCMDKLSLDRAARLAAGEQLEKDEIHPRQFEADVHEEGPPLECFDCHKELPSAYGDPDNPEEQLTTFTPPPLPAPPPLLLPH